MYNKSLHKLISAALMAALTCVATLAIHFPTLTGYIHPGDAFVLLSGIILGPIYGPLAAGLGSMLADLLAAYPHYAIATFIIKAAAALVASLLYKKGKLRSVILGGIIGGVVVTIGYFLFDGSLYGFGASIKGIPTNGIQNALGIVISALLFPILRKVPQIKDMMD